MNPYWEDFIGGITWFVAPGDVAKVGVARPPGEWKPQSPDFARWFPRLKRLLSAAAVSSVSVGRKRYELFSWRRPDGLSTSWLCPPPKRGGWSGLHPDHAVLLRSFGGIVERENEPTWWLLNHNGALTWAESRHDGTFIRGYRPIFERNGAKIPIVLRDYYSIAREANGNTTLCHRRSGKVVLLATDHSFDYVKRLPGCPEYTLYTLVGAPWFRSWVEAVSRQWQNWVDGE